MPGADIFPQNTHVTHAQTPTDSDAGLVPLPTGYGYNSTIQMQCSITVPWTSVLRIKSRETTKHQLLLWSSHNHKRHWSASVVWYRLYRIHCKWRIWDFPPSLEEMLHEDLFCTCYVSQWTLFGYSGQFDPWNEAWKGDVAAFHPVTLWWQQWQHWASSRPAFGWFLLSLSPCECTHIL